MYSWRVYSTLGPLARTRMDATSRTLRQLPRTACRFLHPRPNAMIKVSRMNSFKLNYWVLGDDSSRQHIPTICVGKKVTVNALKKAILVKEKHTLRGMAAKSLDIWKVSIAVEDLDAKLADMRLQDNPCYGVEKLDPRRPLTGAFPDPPADGHLHILVQPPSTSVKTSIHQCRNSQNQSGVPRLRYLEGSQTVYKVDPDEHSNEPLLPGNDGFSRLITIPNIIAVDKTMFIEELDEEPMYQYVFLRPRRWGKTTFLQMLASYYDKSKADEFEDTFSQLYIGRNPTPCHSTLLVLLFDLSKIRTVGPPQNMQADFNHTVNMSLELFLRRNARFLGNPDIGTLIKDDSAASLECVLRLVKSKGEALFVGVDEYDSAANTCLFSRDQEQKSHLLPLTDLLKTQFFAILKEASGDVIRKYWLTGVLPVFRDVNSPLTATSIISRLPQYNGCCGLTEDEVQSIATNYLTATHSDDDLAKVVQEMKTWYGGYSFCPPGYASSSSKLYNPQSIFAHLQAARFGNPVDEDNARHSANMLKAISTYGDVTTNDLLPLLSSELRTLIATNFGVDDVQQVGTNAKIAWGLLYYYGVITQGHASNELRIPNRSMRTLISNQLQEYLMHSNPKFMNDIEASCRAFLEGNPTTFVGLLQTFFQNRPLHLVEHTDKAAFQAVVEAFWYDRHTCISELCLVIDPTKAIRHRHVRFLDLFFISEGKSSSSAIELKNVTLHGLWKGDGVSRVPSMEDLETLQDVLKRESEEQLLQRRFSYYDENTASWRMASIQDVKDEASAQADNYLHALKGGTATGPNTGVHDKRVHCNDMESCLDGYVMMCIGGTRVMIWRTGTVQVQYTFHV